MTYAHVKSAKDVGDDKIGVLSASVFAGMMIGAVVWGTCTILCRRHHRAWILKGNNTGSDLLGRIAAFNGTLILTSLFGILASVSNHFATLCISLFFLGSAVGVSDQVFKLFSYSLIVGLHAN